MIDKRTHKKSQLKTETQNYKSIFNTLNYSWVVRKRYTSYTN